MKEHPILFSGPMVQAIREKRKKQTRRVVRWKPIEPSLDVLASSLQAGHYFKGSPSSGWVLRNHNGATWDDRTRPVKCPYGAKGDRLWVREAFYKDERNRKDRVPQEIIYDATPEIAMDHTGEIVRCRFITGQILSRDEARSSIESNKFWHKKPSLFMPRWASRTLLDLVEEPRIERVNWITEVDAIAEGFSSRADFRLYWDDLNSKRGYEFSGGPWVWVLTFREVIA